jgi:simple sugar transport system permease protein
LAFFFGKRFVAPMAPQLPVFDFGTWSHDPAIHSALRISPLFFLGIAVGLALHYVLKNTRWGLRVLAVGDAPDAARSLGISVRGKRASATVIGASLAAIGGSHLTLYFPGIWSEGISGGQGLMAVALVIFARWNPRRCLAAALLFGAAQALGPSLQTAGITGYYHLFNASPYVLTLAVMIASCSHRRTLAGMPGALASGRG